MAHVAQAAQPKGTLSWGKFIRLVARFFPPIRTLHPTAKSPLRRQNPRGEPGALAAHAGDLCGGVRSNPQEWEASAERRITHQLSGKALSNITMANRRIATNERGYQV